MAPAPGTTLADPVGVDHRPNLVQSSHDISEYLKDQGAYDLFNYLLKELLTQQPDDPVQHMLDCLQTEYPLGPIKVFMSSSPCLGRSRLAMRVAEHFGLEYISAGGLLQEAGMDTSHAGYSDEVAVAELVMERVDAANRAMQGFVLDGFPRTRFQTSFLKEHSIVPTHVLVLKASTEYIRRRQQLIADGQLPCDPNGPVTPDELEHKLRLYSCHASSALEAYQDKISVINVEINEEDEIWPEIELRVRTLPRSRGPKPPPRVVVLGPRGIGVREHTSRLAARLGAVFVDARELTKERQASEALARSSTATTLHTLRTTTSMDISVKHLQAKAAQDKLGSVGVRLRNPDCANQGWVLCGFPTSEHLASLLQADSRLAPTRVVVLRASADTCAQRLRHVLTDAVTGKVWTAMPKNDTIRKRLFRHPEDQPAAVREEHAQHIAALGGILQALGNDGRCIEIKADGAPEAVHKVIVEFVERPLPLPPRN